MIDGVEQDAALAVKSAFARARHRAQPLVVVVDRPRFGRISAVIDQLGWPCINVGRVLPQRLLELPRSRHPLAVERILRDLATDTKTAGAVFFDRLEVLFLPSLKVDPLGVLCRVAQDRPLVVRWPGTFSGTDLAYAEPGHPEYRVFPRPPVEIVDLRPHS